jgi:hypothetical protein
VTERYQGGHLCARDYTRTQPPPGETR